MKTIYWNYLSWLFIAGFLVVYILEYIEVFTHQSSLKSLLVVLFLFTSNIYYRKLLKEKDQEIFRLKQMR
ncbi:MAG: hypothetical protein ACK4JX_00205 [Flavobacterium sp.]